MKTMKPHVTKLLSLLDKPALMKWANEIGLQGIKLEDHRKAAMAKGANLHKQIENYILNNIPFWDTDIQKRWDVFIQGKTILECEKPIETEWFTGRLDIKLHHDGYVYICDFKSQKGVYFETILQLTAYRMGCENVGEFTRIAVIKIPEFKMEVINISDFTPYEEILKSLSNIYIQKSKIYENY